MERQPVWDLAGMCRWDYVKLPWPEKSKLLRRYRGIRINDTCSGCGKFERTWEELQEFRGIPERFHQHPFGLLLYGYVRERGERLSIQRQHREAVFGDDFKI